MKKILQFTIGLALIFAITLLGCNEIENEKDEDVKTTTLTINNQSFTTMKNVVWNSTSFSQGFIMGSIDSPLDISSGRNDKKEVSPGSGYVFFDIPLNPFNNRKLRTNKILNISAGENKEFILIDSTVVIDTGNSSDTPSPLSRFK